MKRKRKRISSELVTSQKIYSPQQKKKRTEPDKDEVQKRRKDAALSKEISKLFK